MFHTIGDSHCKAGWERISELTIKSTILEKRTMYQFGQEKLDFLDIREHGVVEGDTVIFCFGEIDCRFHIYNFSQSEGYEALVCRLVDNYIDAIDQNRALFLT
jgi:hypothetical protein